MRLISTVTGEFEWYGDAQRPKYAILSHTWGEGEILYQDYLYLRNEIAGDEIKTKVLAAFMSKVPRRDSPGYLKIQALCEVARARGHQWVWIDTCCIDRSSSAELSGAINSMWNWYWNAEECLVYLVDVPECHVTKSHLEKWPSGKRLRDETLQKMRKSRWFTRGWTLQEMLAPARLTYYDTNWNMIASRTYLANEVSDITKIPAIYLTDRNQLKEASIAMKMSWMAYRQTTLEEDMGYSLLGLFDISMPLVYGEGRKAFMRLQLELLSKSSDDSILAWTANVEPTGLLARSPTAFADSGHIIPPGFENRSAPQLPSMMTNMGLQVRIPKLQQDTVASKLMNSSRLMFQMFMDNQQLEAELPLACGRIRDVSQPITHASRQEAYENSLCVRLKRIGSRWRRYDCHELPTADGSLRAGGFILAGYMVYYVEQPGL
ncbi:Hypothetical predicted protein [Lecanosticta acicola]|uniref:Heterokaryon incompatibility domain-containing protein n=1 Tax=Lecanosticta acicola TaxID=111012 RepID=A0AAI8YWE4_9PEZI|nr:Hypothetical predicted protein [Lecanosticta acicola]